MEGEIFFVIWDHFHTGDAGKQHALTLQISETLGQAKWE